MRPRVFGGAFQGSVARGQYGSIYVERHESTRFHLGGGMRHRGGAQSAPAGWTPPRRVALPRESTSSMCVQPSPKRRGRRCACNSPSPAPPLKEAVALQKRMITPSLSPYLLRLLQLEVSRSIQVSRRLGCCFHPKWSHGVLYPEHLCTTSCEYSNQSCD